ncbi:MAG TPA: hypothetical protein VFT86_00535 [Gaiellaceae bacterium]|nr:hypothetical protein [Gaiellaceae bacterium]
MDNGRHHLFRLILVAWAVLAAAAAVVPISQAVGPDDRPFYRGGAATLAPKSLGPDDRAYYRGGSASLAPKSLGPDDRAFARGVGVEPRTISTAASATHIRFHWEDALIGGAFGIVLTLLGGGALLIAIRHAPTRPHAA